MTVTQQLDNGSTRLLVTPGNQLQTMRPVIDIVNSSLDIISIEPAMPSMEEIFIETVKNYNSTHNITENNE